MSIRIASFNLESLDDRPGLEPPLEQRIAKLRPQLARLEADILCLQEVNAQHREGKGARSLVALDRLIRDTPYRSYAWVASDRAKTGVLAEKHNLVVLSRWPILDRQVIYHDFVPPLSHRYVTAAPASAEPVSIAWDRPILKATIELPGDRPLHLFNLHLRAPLAAPVPGQKRAPLAWRSLGAWAEGFFLSDAKRCGQALEARLALEPLFNRHSDALIAVCGDFNAEQTETPLRILCGDIEDTGSTSLANRSLLALERRLPESQRFTVIHGGRRIMLDHILASRALHAQFRQIEAHNETLADEVASATVGHPLGDFFHAPVVAEFADFET